MSSKSTISRAILGIVLGIALGIVLYKATSIQQFSNLKGQQSPVNSAATSIVGSLDPIDCSAINSSTYYQCCSGDDNHDNLIGPCCAEAAVLQQTLPPYCPTSSASSATTAFCCFPNNNGCNAFVVPDTGLCDASKGFFSDVDQCIASGYCPTSSSAMSASTGRQMYCCSNRNQCIPKITASSASTACIDFGQPCEDSARCCGGGICNSGICTSS